MKQKQFEVELIGGEITMLRPVKYYPAWKNVRDGVIFIALIGGLLWGLLKVAAIDYQHEQQVDQLQTSAQSI